MSSGSSASAVAEPTATASAAARSAWTAARAAGPVIQRDSPRAVAMRPSSVAASFSATQGRPRSVHERKPRCCSRHSASRTPDATSTPARAEPAEAARRATCGFGSRWPTQTRRDARPRRMASVHGRRAPVVAARLERDRERRAAQRRRAVARARRRERHDLGVRPARRARVAARRACGRRAARPRRPAGSARCARSRRRAPRAPGAWPASGVTRGVRSPSRRSPPALVAASRRRRVVLGALEAAEHRGEARGRDRVERGELLQHAARRGARSRSPSRSSPGAGARRGRRGARCAVLAHRPLGAGLPDAARELARGRSPRGARRA